jgi:hypothetical protein
MCLVTILCCYSKSTHTLWIKNETSVPITTLVLWPDGKASNLCTLLPHTKTYLRITIKAEGHSEVFFKQNDKWYHENVDDYMCPNISSSSVFIVKTRLFENHISELK